MKQTTMLLAFVASLALLNSCQDKINDKEIADEKNEEKFENKEDRKDADFVVDAIASSNDEVGLADDAIRKATSTDVKKLATQIKDEHSVLENELRSMANTRSITVPDSSASNMYKTLEDLSDEKGIDYDKKWLKEMEDMHEKCARKYDDAAKDSSDSSIKAWAGNILVKIRGHLDLIKSTRDKIK